MYQKRKVSLELKEVLDRLAAKKEGRVYRPIIAAPKATVYAASDVLRASFVLARLMEQGNRNEVSYIRHPIKVVRV